MIDRRNYDDRATLVLVRRGRDRGPVRLEHAARDDEAHAAATPELVEGRQHGRAAVDAVNGVAIANHNLTPRRVVGDRAFEHDQLRARYQLAAQRRHDRAERVRQTRRVRRHHGRTVTRLEGDRDLSIGERRQLIDRGLENRSEIDRLPIEVDVAAFEPSQVAEFGQERRQAATRFRSLPAASAAGRSADPRGPSAACERSQLRRSAACGTREPTRRAAVTTASLQSVRTSEHSTAQFSFPLPASRERVARRTSL